MALTGRLGTPTSTPGNLQLGTVGTAPAGSEMYSSTVSTTQAQALSLAHVPATVSEYVLHAQPGNTKVLDLGTGGTPPANWQTAGFDDSTWATPRNDTAGGPDYITIPGYPNVPNYALFRWRTTITVPAGGMLSLVTGHTVANDDFLECWINGVRVSALGEATGTAGPNLSADVTAYVNVGANLIAFQTRNTSGSGYSDFTSYADLTVDTATPITISPVLWKGPGTWFLLATTDSYVYWGSGAFQSNATAGQLVFWNPDHVFTETP